MAKTTRIYNRGSRVFQHHPHVLRPGMFTEVPADLADFFLKTYPEDFISPEDATRPSAAEALAAEKDKEIADLKRRLAELEVLGSPAPSKKK
jgi:hypothetical protein